MERPQSIIGVTTEVQTGCGALFVIVNKADNGYWEVLLRMGKTGGCQSASMEAVGKLITFALCSRVSRRKIVRALRGIQCPNPRVSGGVKTMSCYDAIALVLEADGKPLDSITWADATDAELMAMPSPDHGMACEGNAAG